MELDEAAAITEPAARTRRRPLVPLAVYHRLRVRRRDVVVLAAAQSDWPASDGTGLCCADEVARAGLFAPRVVNSTLEQTAPALNVTPRPVSPVDTELPHDEPPVAEPPGVLPGTALAALPSDEPRAHRSIDEIRASYFAEVEALARKVAEKAWPNATAEDLKTVRDLFCTLLADSH